MGSPGNDQAAGNTLAADSRSYLRYHRVLATLPGLNSTRSDIHTISIVKPIIGKTIPSAVRPTTHARIGGLRTGLDGAPIALPGLRLRHITKPLIDMTASPSEISDARIWFATPK